MTFEVCFLLWAFIVLLHQHGLLSTNYQVFPLILVNAEENFTTVSY